MTIRKSILAVSFLMVLVSLTPAAQAGEGDHTWGPRLGLGIAPGVAFAGLHLDFGPVAPDFHLRLLGEGGLGQDKTHIALGLQGLRFFDANSKGWRPYLGGEAGVNYFYRDNLKDKTLIDISDPYNPKKIVIRADHTTAGMALNLVGGIEGNLSGGRKWFAELRGGLLKGPQGKVVIGWLF